MLRGRVFCHPVPGLLYLFLREPGAARAFARAAPGYDSCTLRAQCAAMNKLPSELYHATQPRWGDRRLGRGERAFSTRCPCPPNKKILQSPLWATEYPPLTLPVTPSRGSHIFPTGTGGYAGICPLTPGYNSGTLRAQCADINISPRS